MSESVFQHRSIRKFQKKEIEPDVLTRILEAAVRASNTGNMQWYSIIATKSSELKDQLCEQAHFNQAMVKEAPVVLTFCADINRFNKWCEQRNAEPGYDNFLSFYTASIDAVIAAQNACIQAEDEGLGICYLGTTNYNAPKIREILNLPQYVLPVTTVVMGYPDETPELTGRLPLEAVVHDETYSDYTAEQIDNLYDETENRYENKEFVKINETENLAQIFTEKRYPKNNNKVFSNALLKEIEKQGFMNND